MEDQKYLSQKLSLLSLVILLISIKPSNCASSSANKAYVTKACNKTTPFSTQCMNSLSPFANKINSNPKSLCKYTISAALTDSKAAKSMAKKVAKTKGFSASDKAAMRDCVDTIADSVEKLRDCTSALKRVKGKNMRDESNGEAVEDMKTWASASLTNYETCTDGLDEQNVDEDKVGKFRDLVVKAKASNRILLAIIAYTTS